MRLHDSALVHALKIIVSLLLAGVAGVLLVLVAAPAGSRVPVDTLVVGLDGDPRSLDPHTTTASSDFRVLVNLYEGLVRFRSGTLSPGPALARRWEVSDDGKRYTFFLEPGVRFHDGTRCDAEAVKFNFERMLRKDHPYHHTGPFPLAFFFERIQRVEVVDALTVRFELDQPFAPLLSNLAYPTGLLVSPSAVRQYGTSYKRHPVGTGPFRLSRFRPGTSVELVRNDSYRAPRSGLERLVFRPIRDAMTRVAELRAGQLGLAFELSPDNVRWFRGREGFQVIESAGPHLWFLILNTKLPPFDDVRVRRAVNYAVDKRALVEHVLQGTATIAAGPIPAAFGDPAGTVEPYPHDPAEARRLLQEAGVAPGTPLVLEAPESGSGMLAPMQMATAIQADLRRVGLAVQVRSYEWNSYLSRVNAGLDSVHMAEMAWMTNDPDTLPFLALRSQARPPEGFNSGWYSNPTLDELLVTARRETNDRARAGLYAEVQRIAHDDVPWLFVASWKQNVVARGDVQGLELEPSFLLYLDGVSKR